MILKFFQKKISFQDLYDNFKSLSERNEVVVNTEEKTDILELKIVILLPSVGFLIEKNKINPIKIKKFEIKPNLDKQIFQLLTVNAEKMSMSSFLEHLSHIFSSYQTQYQISFNEEFLVINTILHEMQPFMKELIFYTESEKNLWID